MLFFNTKNRHIMMGMLIFFSIKPIHGQQISGTVVDTQTNEPLAFVSVLINSTQQAVFTDLDGKFLLENNTNTPVEFLQFSFMGYHSIRIEKPNAKPNMLVKLMPKSFEIQQVTILPGENPAHPIIRKAIRNKNKHRPENLNSYSLRVYNKLVFTLEQADSLKKNKPRLSDTSTASDSALVKLVNFLDRQYLFMSESLSEKKYKKPGQTYQKIIASRISGFQQPIFGALDTELQAFSFYENTVTLADKDFVNPLSAGAISRYFFNLEDTLITPNNDSVFVISFRPRKNKKFDALQGVLQINNDGYALQSVTAKPANRQEIINYTIEQKFQKKNGTHWFPVQLHARILFNSISVNLQKDGAPFPVVGISRTYITDIQINPEISNSDIKINGIEQVNTLRPKADEVFEQYRPKQLTNKELTTFQKLDSVGKTENLDQKINTLKTVAYGYIPYYFLDIDYLSIIDYNEYEKFRVGIAARLNDKFSRYIHPHGFVAYGTRDKRWKYGGGIHVAFPSDNLWISVGYQTDLQEVGLLGLRLINTDLAGSALLRDYLISQMNVVQESYANVAANINSNLMLQMGVYLQNVRYMGSQIQTDMPGQRWLENNIALRWAPGQKVVKTFFGSYVQPSKWPVLSVDYKWYSPTDFKQQLFSKISLNLDYQLKTSALGQSKLSIIAAKAMGDVPFNMLYNGRGSYYDFTVDVEKSFGSMRMGEFWASQFVSFFWKHQFNFMLIKRPKIRPQPALVFNAGWGMLQKNYTNPVENVVLSDFHKGYYEAGLQLNSLYTQAGLIHYGIAVYYRIGNYALSNLDANLAYKLTLRFGL